MVYHNRTSRLVLTGHAVTGVADETRLANLLCDYYCLHELLHLDDDLGSYDRTASSS